LLVAEPLTEAEQEEKEALIAKGFEDWSRRDFQQFVRALENYGWLVNLTLDFLDSLLNHPHSNQDR
jgi:hypothetical protein